jgi:hypothetical protein
VAGLRERLLAETIGRLARHGASAVDTLATLMKDVAQKGPVRVSAATGILGQLFRGIETHDFADKLAALETRKAKHK